jgi:hypothetical protein
MDASFLFSILEYNEENNKCLMLKISVSENIINHCKGQVDKYNFGMRVSSNGTKDQQLVGIIGQSVIMSLFDLPFVDGNSGFDNGVDIEFCEVKIDVKTMGRNTDVKRDYVNNFLRLQDYFDCDAYIFCSYHKTKKELTICGWIDKKSFNEKRKYYPKGTERKRFDGTSFVIIGDNFEILNSDLYDVESLDDLKNQLVCFGQKLKETKKLNFNEKNGQFYLML